MTGSILQINVSRGGLPKRAIPEAELTLLSIAGDLCAHPQFHGGPRQALLLISAEGIDELAALGFPLFHGALGENITTRGLDRRMWRVGQRWRIGPAVKFDALPNARAGWEEVAATAEAAVRALADAGGVTPG